MNRDGLLAALAVYAATYAGEPAEMRTCERIAAFVKREPRWFDRTTRVGHLTGSAWVTDEQGTAAPLVHHRTLDRWLQPGGHPEATDTDVFATAAREAREELGIAVLSPVTLAIYDVDVHDIPARGEEPAHLHYDIRYAFTAPCRALAASEESFAVRWMEWAEIRTLPIDASMRRLIRKTRPALSLAQPAGKPL